jgi:2-polyprenyl-3-methyl-5-hydroxy-6-metoxy-1,4-benzoquinol methylase
VSGDDEQLLAILRRNTGFDEPELWIDYARRHNFKPVMAVKIPRCPDCFAASKKRVWGQYVYYSTLIRLLECEQCGLVWADARIDRDVVRQHFETAYKSDEYFRGSRNAIFEHLAAVIDNLAVRNARILDVGGARGDLMAKVVSRRPDINATVHDLSRTATDWAAEHFGFPTLTGSASALASHSEQYDVVVLSDVMYYEPNLALLWKALSRLIRRGGAIVIRVPNKAMLVWIGRLWFRLTHARIGRVLQDRTRFHNPEHIFVFRQHYLRNRLMSIGFKCVQTVPSPPLISAESSGLGSVLFRHALIANRLTRSKLVLTPSMLVIGTRRHSPDVMVGLETSPDV